jgi:hypothetical protein
LLVWGEADNDIVLMFKKLHMQTKFPREL